MTSPSELFAAAVDALGTALGELLSELESLTVTVNTDHDILDGRIDALEATVARLDAQLNPPPPPPPPPPPVPVGP